MIKNVNWLQLNLKINTVYRYLAKECRFTRGTQYVVTFAFLAAGIGAISSIIEIITQLKYGSYSSNLEIDKIQVTILENTLYPTLAIAIAFMFSRGTMFVVTEIFRLPDETLKKLSDQNHGEAAFLLYDRAKQRGAEGWQAIHLQRAVELKHKSAIKISRKLKK